MEDQCPSALWGEWEPSLLQSQGRQLTCLASGLISVWQKFPGEKHLVELRQGGFHYHKHVL